MTIRAIWAQSTDGIIGNGTAICWSVPEDMTFFKNITMWGTVIMGRRTWDTLRKRPLSGRRNIVLTTGEPGDWAAGAEVAHSVDDALRLASTDENVWIIGGGEVYHAFFDHCAEALVTTVDVTLADELHEKNERAVYAPPLPDDAPRTVVQPATQSSSGLSYRIDKVTL